MADAPIIPKHSEIVAPGIDALVALKPAALAHINDGTGQWAQVLGMLKAQGSLALNYLADEIQQARLAFASGSGLTDLLRSEYNVPLDLGPTFAVGEVQTGRITAATNGVIPKGTRYIRRANPRAVPLPLQAAEYESTETVVFIVGDYEKSVKIRALRPGPHANTVTENVVDGAPNNIVLENPSSLFDTFATVYGLAAGGSIGVTDDDLRKIGKYYATGQYGPTKLGIAAGALLAGARQIKVVDDPSTGTTFVHVSDESWAASEGFQNSVIQKVKDQYAGFGAGQIVALGTTNEFVKVECSIQLRTNASLGFTDDITTAINVALRSYFDDRPDWDNFQLSAIRGVIARADRRILTCTSAVVKNRFGSVLTPQLYRSFYNSIHYYFADNALVPTYVAPV